MKKKIILEKDEEVNKHLRNIVEVKMQRMSLKKARRLILRRKKIDTNFTGTPDFVVINGNDDTVVAVKDRKIKIFDIETLGIKFSKNNFYEDFDPYHQIEPIDVRLVPRSGQILVFGLSKNEKKSCLKLMKIAIKGDARLKLHNIAALNTRIEISKDELFTQEKIFEEGTTIYFITYTNKRITVYSYDTHISKSTNRKKEKIKFQTPTPESPIYFSKRYLITMSTPKKETITIRKFCKNFQKTISKFTLENPMADTTVKYPIKNFMFYSKHVVIQAGIEGFLVIEEIDSPWRAKAKFQKSDFLTSFKNKRHNSLNIVHSDGRISMIRIPQFDFMFHNFKFSRILARGKKMELDRISKVIQISSEKQLFLGFSEDCFFNFEDDLSHYSYLRRWLLSPLKREGSRIYDVYNRGYKIALKVDFDNFLYIFTLENSIEVLATKFSLERIFEQSNFYTVILIKYKSGDNSYTIFVNNSDGKIFYIKFSKENSEIYDKGEVLFNGKSLITNKEKIKILVKSSGILTLDMRESSKSLKLVELGRNGFEARKGYKLILFSSDFSSILKSWKIRIAEDMILDVDEDSSRVYFLPQVDSVVKDIVVFEIFDKNNFELKRLGVLRMGSGGYNDDGYDGKYVRNWKEEKMRKDENFGIFKKFRKNQKQEKSGKREKNSKKISREKIKFFFTSDNFLMLNTETYELTIYDKQFIIRRNINIAEFQKDDSVIDCFPLKSSIIGLYEYSFEKRLNLYYCFNFKKNIVRRLVGVGEIVESGDSGLKNFVKFKDGEVVLSCLDGIRAYI